MKITHSMSLFRVAVLTIALCAYISDISAKNITFKHLDIKDGLSQISVTSIVSDDLGQMWFGTRHGFNYYDGERIRTLTMKTADGERSFDRPRYLSADSVGNIYFTSDEELVIYSKRYNTFRSLGKEITSIYHDSDGLWATKGRDILKYDKQQDKLVLYKTLHSLPRASAVRCILRSGGESYIGTDEGLYKLASDGTEHLILPNVEVPSMYADRAKNIWVSSNNKGLFKIATDKTIVHFTSDRDNSFSLSSNNVRCVAEDLEGNIWIGTSTGLNKLDRTNQTITHYAQDKENIMSLSDNSIMSVYCDSQGTIWVGSFMGGVDYFNPAEQVFSYPVVGTNRKTKLRIGKICHLERGKYLMQTSLGPQYYYINENRFSDIGIREKLLFTCFATDSVSKKIYCGTYDGIYVYDITKDIFLPYQITDSNSALPSNSIRAMAICDNVLYIATNKGFARYNTLDNSSESFLAHFVITTSTPSVMYVDSQKRLWIGFLCSKMIEYNIQTAKILMHNELPPKAELEQTTRISKIFEDSQHRLWLATSSKGLYLFNRDKNSFELFADRTNGLMSNQCFDIQQGPSGILVLFENNGITFIDASKREFTYLHKARFIGDKILNEGCGYSVDDKFNIVIGTIDGIVAFNYKELPQNSINNKLIFSKLYINSEEVFPNEDSGAITQSLPYVSELNIGGQYQSFDIEIANMNYLKFGNTNVEYKLEGFDDKWIIANQNRIHYTNINPGSYTLRIRLLDGDNKTYIENSLVINIHPPFYFSTLAIAIYITIIVLLLLFVARFYESKRKLKLDLIYEQKDKQRIENLNRERIKFYINLSHELLTPLSLIMVQIETLMIDCKDLSSHIRNRVNRIYRNADMLNMLIKGILDFRKSEYGQTNLKISGYNIVSVVEEVVELFNDKAKMQDIDLCFVSESNDIELFVDKAEFQKVISNLLSNALKFTPKGGRVSVSCRRKSHSVLISISDTGTGIPADSIDKVFDRFYQASNTTQASGTGIGLSYVKDVMNQHNGTISVENNEICGCTFTLEFKEGYGHVAEIEHNAQKEFECESDNSVVEYESLDNSEHLLSKILIVEDNEEMLNILVSIFRPIYYVKQAHSGEEALELLSTFMPDIILSDVMMGGVSGIKLCSTIKSNYETCHIPVVLLTAQNFEDTNIDGLQNGADDYITKPFKVQLLVARCNNLINNRKILQNKFANQANFEPQIFATNQMDMLFIESAQRVIEQNFDNPNFGVDLFAKEMLMSRAKLYSKIKGVTGMTPKDFILNIKLKKAADYLTNKPELLIADIAYKLGFGSARQFSESFKELFGINPAKYRKK